MNSKIYLYDDKTKALTTLHENYEYLDGSFDLNWEGIDVERIRSKNNTVVDVYFKDYCFALTTESKIDYIISDTLVSNKTDDVFIHPMNKPFSLVNNNAYEAIFFMLTHDFLKEHFYTKDIDDVNFIENYQVNDLNVNHLLKLIYHQSLNQADKNDRYLNHLFDSLVTYYIYNYSDFLSKDETAILGTKDLDAINQYLDINIGKNITYYELAKLINMSNYTFLNEFKKKTDFTPHQYILQRKLALSKKLLMDSVISITEISHYLGFADGSHFSRFFKKHTGISPSKYKNRISANSK